jgi:hypothetical protein
MMRSGRDVLFCNPSLAMDRSCLGLNSRHLCEQKFKPRAWLRGKDELIDSPDHSSEMMGR